MGWGRGQLWLGSTRSQIIRSIGNRPGDRTIACNRFVTGVSGSKASCGTAPGRRRERDRDDPTSGEAARAAADAERKGVSGSNRGADFYAGGGASGKVRAVGASERIRSVSEVVCVLLIASGPYAAGAAQRVARALVASSRRQESYPEIEQRADQETYMERRSGFTRSMLKRAWCCRGRGVDARA